MSQPKSEKDKLGMDMIKRSIERVIKKEKQRKNKKKEKILEEELEERASDKKYKAWLKIHKPKFQKAAKIIWSWYQKFIASKEFEDMAIKLEKLYLNEIGISEVIAGNTRSGGPDQFLSIDFKEGLFVHSCVKYGKSKPIEELDDLLECVEFPVLIEIAETIKDKTIWAIIDDKINSELDS